MSLEQIDRTKEKKQYNKAIDDSLKVLNFAFKNKLSLNQIKTILNNLKKK